MRPKHSPPITGRDLAAIGGGLAFAATLLAPARHYIGSLKKVTEAKIEHDSFPLSTYPMFSADRKGRIVIPHVIGFTETGERVVPHYRHYGTGGLNQVRKQIARDVRLGRAAMVAQKYADSIAAERTTDPTVPLYGRREREAAITRIAVVRARYVFDDWFNGDRAPESEVEHAECVVGGTAVELAAGPLPRYKKGK